MQSSIVDYVAHAEFMLYEGELLPSRLVFVSVRDPTEKIVMKPCPDSLGPFSFRDVLISRCLPNDPFKPIPSISGDRLELVADVRTSLLQNDMLVGGGGGIGTVDTATFFYLLPILRGEVKFLPFPQELRGDLLTAHPDARDIALAVAKHLHAKCSYPLCWDA